MITAAVVTNVGYIGYQCYKTLRAIKVGDRVRLNHGQCEWKVMDFVENEAFIMPIDPDTGARTGASEWYNTKELVHLHKEGWVDNALQFTALFMQKLAYDRLIP